MYYKRGFISFLFFSFLPINIPAQVNLPDTPYCEKSFKFLRYHCYECNNYTPPQKSKVEKFDFLGKVNEKFYYYGVYIEDSTKTRSGYKSYQFGIYEGNAKESILKPVHFFFPRFNWYDYYDFKMIKTEYGYIIHIQCVRNGAGWDEGEYIIYRNGKWERLREPNWFCAAEGLLPEDYSLDFHSSDSYIKIDLKTMTIKIPVEKKVNEIFTPTDGYVLFNLVVEKDRFGIANSKYVPDLHIQNLESNSNKDSFSYCEKTIDFLQNNCYNCGDSSKDVDCKIKEFKYFGEGNGKQYYYGLYHQRNKKSDYYDRYFIIYEGKKNNKNLKPIHYIFDEDVFDYYNFEITNTKYGLIIHIYLTNGNGAWDDGEYIIYRNGRWEKLKIPEWECVYEWIKPDEYWFCKGSTIDLKTMTIKFPVYSFDDPCSAPTKGIVKSNLTIDRDGFRVISSKYYPDQTEW